MALRFFGFGFQIYLVASVADIYGISIFAIKNWIIPTFDLSFFEKKKTKKAALKSAVLYKRKVPIENIE